jgi:hypothetical protein
VFFPETWVFSYLLFRIDLSACLLNAGEFWEKLLRESLMDAFPGFFASL